MAVLSDRRLELSSFHTTLCSEITAYTIRRRNEMKKIVCTMIKIQLANEEQIRSTWLKVLEDVK